MGGGGKGGSTTVNKTEIPPEVLARYNAVNARAETVAEQPYQAYSQDPNAFVAPLTQTQQAGIQNTNAMAGAAQPYYGAATQQLMQAQAGAQPGINAAYQNIGQAQQQGQGYLGAATGVGLAGAQGVSPGALNVNQYMNPYTQNVVNATQAAMNQQQGQQLSQQQTDAIKGGAFGGDRANMQRGILQGQQSLAQAQAIAPLYQQNYNQALGAAQQQQGVNLGAQQANRAAIQNYGQQLGNLGQQGYQQGMGAAQQQAALAQQGYNMGSQTSQNLASLGTNAQQAGLAGAQAQLQAGQGEQQTQQAGLQALYNQFQQKQGYPFQVAQFLANIAEGTGALSGNQSTQTTTGGGGFFSDRRLKENVKKVGETNDGQPIYRYNYKGDPRTQIGLMAQDVEKHHPEAVGLAGGYKTVDYKKATDDAVHSRRHFSGEEGSFVAPSADAYSMTGSPSAMLSGLSLPSMRTGSDIHIQPGAINPEAAGLLAPKATGYSLGTREGKQAEADSLRSSLASGNASGIGSGPDYLRSRLTQLDDFLSQHASAGGLVGPEGGAFAQGGSFARGGLAFGGVPDYSPVNPAVAYYGPKQGQEGIYGVPIQQGGPRQMMQGTQIQRPAQANPIGDAEKAASLGLKGYDLYKKGREWMKSDEGYDNEWEPSELKDPDLPNDTDAIIDLETPFARGGLIGHRGHYSGGAGSYVNPKSSPFAGANDWMGIEQQPQQFHMMKAGEMPRQQQQQSGLGSALQGASALKSGKSAYDWAAKQLSGEASPTAMSSTSTEAGGLAGAAEAPGAAVAETAAGAAPVAETATGAIAGAAPEALTGAVTGGVDAAASTAAPLFASGLDAAGMAGGLAGAGETAALLGTGAEALTAGAGIMEALPFLAFLSDDRAKHDIKKVGKLFDGQPVYRYAYNGDDKTQMGLIAQKVEKDRPEAVGLAGGMKAVDYKKATDKAAQRGHFADGRFVYPEILDKDVGEEDYVPSPPKPEESIPLPAAAPAEPPVRGDRAATPAPGLGAAPTPPAVRVGDNELTVVPPSGIPDNRGNVMPPARVAKPSKNEERRASANEPTFPSLGGLLPTGARETLSSENFWVPALSGIGAMLASPNKTLAGAIGSGLVGGTSAYMGLEKQQSEIAKNSLDVFNKIFEQREDGAGNVAYMNLQTGKLSTPQEAFNVLKGMPGFSGLAKAQTAAAKEAPQRDATVALASDVVDKGVEPVTPRIAAAPPAGGVARAAANAPAETTVLAPGAPPARPAGAAPAAKPEEGNQLASRLPEQAQKDLLEADAWARSQPDVRAHIDEAKKQRALAQQAQDRLSGMVSPRMKEIAAKQFETANKQATEAETRAEAAVTRLVDPLHKEISRRLNTSTEAIAAAARLKREEALAVLDPEIVRRQAEAAGAKTRAEKTEEALIEEATTVLTDPDTGVKYKLPLDPTTRKPVAAPPAQPPMNGAPAPKKAEIEPLTRAVIAGRPTPPKGGGMPIHANLPGNAMIVGDLDDKSREVIKEDAKFYGDLINKSESLTVGSQRYNTITNAFKLFQSGPGAVPLSEYAAIAKSWGAPDIAKTLFDGDPDAVQVLQKEAPGLVLEQLKAATPRFAQSEFNALLNRAVPEGGRLPEANFQMVAQGLAIMNRSNAFLDSWADAQADGWRSMSAYYLEWGKANPMPAYLESAKLQMGNFAGMPIPPKDKLAVGATYVTPKELDGETKAAMGALGIQPGDIWRYNGGGAKPTVIPRADMFSVYMGY